MTSDVDTAARARPAPPVAFDPYRPPPTDVRASLRAFVDHDLFHTAVLILIIANAVVLALETSATIRQQFGPLLDSIDRLFVFAFSIEVALRLIAHGIGHLRNGWYLFDLIVVLLSLSPDTGSLSVLRAMRVLRIMRLVSAVPSMRLVVRSLGKAIPGMASVGGLLLLMFFIFSVMACKLFGQTFPHWFGSMPSAMYTLFQIMTLESWSMDVVRPILAVYPYAWLFFIPFILCTTFAVMNLFIAIVVNAMAEEQAQEAQKLSGVVIAAGHEDARQISDDIAALRAEIRQLRGLMQAGSAQGDRR